jgi:glycosyltransferase involved in cell wall biosynthesis
MPKKIVFVIESLQLGGSEKSLVTLLQHLDPDEWAIDLLVFHRGGIFEQQVPGYVHIIYQDFPALHIWERLQYKWKRSLLAGRQHSQQMLWPLIKNKFKKYTTAYDIAIAYSQGFATYYTAQFIQARVKYTWMNVDYVQAHYQFAIDAPYYKAFDAMVCVSPLVQQSMQQVMQAHAVSLQTHIIPDIVQVEEIIRWSKAPVDNYPQDSSKIQLLTVGRLKEEKGLLLAVEACKILIEKGHAIVWTVVGEGSQRPVLEKAIRDHALEKHFILAGATDNPYAYMARCNMYVQTSLYEGLGLTLIEAAILGKPIISTDFPTAYDTIVPGETGLITSMQAAAIADAVCQYIQNPSLALQYGMELQKATVLKHQHTFAKVLTLLNSK